MLKLVTHLIVCCSLSQIPLFFFFLKTQWNLELVVSQGYLRGWNSGKGAPPSGCHPCGFNSTWDEHPWP